MPKLPSRGPPRGAQAPDRLTGLIAPRIDAKGNSERGVKGVTAVAEKFGPNALDCTNLGWAVAGAYLG
ncbi:MAG: hypothetical protein U1E16_00180 [Hyphomicrobiales bacterium]